ncbi:penicillin-binding protein 1A [Sinorhizobium meliloti]|uniref:penicillin-binding protein 1A n=1 Tax=Rhizobium meliloti TaxID=382 RepID=UPI0018E043AD|nr:penicillin-binding protein 1A [Sinorhizobium meliloti]MCK3785884.1 penicillin-binding protein 1A [Sinorhizobium meliloti]MCK3792010.1 penicillin-binding protein 1A [Sinorhizobium meliloti]MCK3796859.1 penicillin-binding protein 1A [Sinorhizobium meliloti]
MKLIGYIFGITSAALLGIFGIGAVYLWEVANDLPDHRKLAEWEPALMTRFYAYDGTPIAEYARERRLYLPIAAIPERVKAAFLSAEDKSFYSHSGIDVLSVFKAAWSNAVNLGSGQRLIGASTITQQLAKNFLLSSDRTLRRKIKEAVLSIRIEHSLSKDRILELYLNDIYLGLGAYGIAAGALTYFEKSVSELTVAEAAYLAALPKGPNNYNPHRHPERAVRRRNWVIGQMQRNGFVSAAQASNMMARPLGVKPQAKNPVMAEANYFVEEVRREVAGQYGEAALYDGGLSVRTTLDPILQAAALMALRAGLVDYDQARGFRGAVAHIDISGDWATALAKHETFTDMKEWQLAVVLSCSDAGVGIGLRRAKLGPEHSPTSPETGLIGRNTMRWALKLAAGGKIRQVDSIDKVLSPGDVIYVEKVGNGYLLRQIPEVQGAIVSMDPNTGRVLASVGGFSFAQSRFNRATQASRQPGSAFKPFVYAAALDTGYTPATLVMDAPFSMPDGAGRLWKPKNYDGKFGGPSTLRTGLEMSRNLMTVRLARHLGMDLVAEYGRAFGLYDKLAPYLPMSLGAGETTLTRLVSAYAVLANGGHAVQPSMIDRIQDRHGRTIFRHDDRACDRCNATRWLHQEEPVLRDTRKQVLDPMTAYQVTSMLRGVVERGTAHRVSQLGAHVAGKTGTTNDEKDVWFVGYTPTLVTGIFMGYDAPKPMGYGETGGGLAAPIFIDFMKVAMSGRPAVDFPVPQGLTFASVNRRTGKRAASGDPDSAVEVFKPGTGPCLTECPVIDGFGAEGAEFPAALREQLLTAPHGLY